MLRYHSLPSMHSAEALEVVELFPTSENGQSVLVNGLTAQDGLTQINDAGLTEGDIHASNGIIHKISRVVHPPGATCM